MPALQGIMGHLAPPWRTFVVLGVANSPQHVNVPASARSASAPITGRQQPGVFDGQVMLVKVHQGVAHDDRAAVSSAEQRGEVGVLSAACFGGGGLSRDAGFVDRRRPVAASRPSRHRGARTGRSAPVSQPTPCAECRNCPQSRATSSTARTWPTSRHGWACPSPSGTGARHPTDGWAENW